MADQPTKCRDCRKLGGSVKAPRWRILRQVASGDWIEVAVCRKCALIGSGAPSLESPRGELTVRQRTKKH